jgi:hypothetical protein
MQYKELGDTTEYTDTFEFEGDLPFW